MGNIKKNRSGLTLIELILSIAIIGMIIISFMPLFLMSAKNNSKSESTLDATHLGKDVMEFAYHLSTTKTIGYDNLTSEMVNAGYTDISDSADLSSYAYGMEHSSGKYIKIEFTEDGNLINVLVKIYKHHIMVESELEVQYESLYFWEVE